MLTERLTNLILLFFSYAFLGWCIEVTLKYFQFHRFINRGFLTGPFRRHDLCSVVPPVRAAGISDKLYTGKTLPCPLVGLQSKAHEPSRPGMDWEPDPLRPGRRGDCGSDQSAVASSFRTHEPSPAGDYSSLPISGLCCRLCDVTLCAETCQDKR